MPTDRSYTQPAGLPLPAGSYASILAMLAYAHLGSKPQLNVETSASTATLSGAIVASLALSDQAYFIALSAAGAVKVGPILIVAGIAKLSFIADILAKPIIGGFLFGPSEEG